jgi:hypothetical protein
MRRAEAGIAAPVSPSIFVDMLRVASAQHIVRRKPRKPDRVRG